VGNLLSDVRYCLRGFARRPLFAAVVVVTLALGLGINAAAPFAGGATSYLRSELAFPEFGVALALAIAIGQAGRTLLYGLTPTDPLVPAAAILTLAAVVLAAAYWPARRAARVDPVTALRGD
jgi:putative ABC transport system permease protein